MTKKRYTCDSCSKVRMREHGARECIVLTHLIGRRANCWAWSNDEFWEEKIKADTKKYALDIIDRHQNDINNAHNNKNTKNEERVIEAKQYLEDGYII